MYTPSYFEETRVEVLQDLIERHPLGVLVTHGGGVLDANHLPFDLQRDGGPLGVLHCHVARVNPVWRELSDGDEVLVVFRAGEAYISPNWYPSKHERHKQVPTWNYIVAHAHGKVTIRDDAEYVRGVVERLTRRHEASQTIPWSMSDSSESFINSLIQGIVGIEIQVTRLIGKSKLSQNKELRDILGAGEALQVLGEGEVSGAMLSHGRAMGEPEVM